ncbi:MAG TPA: HD domain-containing phosphohydrolase [Pyrinomonadaceae bacterium]|jgi:HD-GYP domain-containing protein (c-di-GMP phosphodiesterase class II)|nr:HD domain-containing phosphohydrolase [Pyrinomonadaceae bacterium]
MPDSMLKVLHAFAALADLGEEIAGTSDFEEMVSSSLHVVLGALGIRRGAVAEYDRANSALRFVAARGMGEALPPDVPIAFAEINSSSPAESRNGGNGHDREAGSESSRVESQLKPHISDLPVEVVVPLTMHGELVGVIMLGDKASDEPFTLEDRELVRALGRHIGVGIYNHRLLREVEQRAEENRRLYYDLRTIYKDTVRAFAAAIDCKDKYTQGHSERVGKYSEIIAREMGWDDEEVEGIAVAGYLHDIGKLVVDRDIINAPYKIDAKKSSELNRHPAAGYEILSPINHPYADIPLMARYHHERIDGRGYPEGLSGEQIPLGAKIVALADSFDAMTTDRPYKRRRAFDEVVEDFRRNTGKQFAPEVVAAFCRALLKEAKGETRPRQIIRLLGKDYIDGEQVVPLLEGLISELESGASLTAAQG